MLSVGGSRYAGLDRYALFDNDILNDGWNNYFEPSMKSDLYWNSERTDATYNTGKKMIRKTMTASRYHK